MPDNVSIRGRVSSDAAITSSLIFTGKTTSMIIYYGHIILYIPYRVLIITINAHGHNVIVDTSQSWHVWVCGDVCALLLSLSTYTKYKQAKHTVQTHARRPPPKLRRPSTPLRRVLFYFFPITFSFSPSGLRGVPLHAAYGGVLLALFKAEYLYLHITHTRARGRRTIIYRTTSSVRRVRHPCATRQHTAE